MRGGDFFGLVVVVLAFTGILLVWYEEWPWCALVYALGFMIQTARLP